MKVVLLEVLFEGDKDSLVIPPGIETQACQTSKTLCYHLS